MIRLVEKLLEKHAYYIEKGQFEELFLSHPNYPSLFAITDSLDLLSIENIAANVPKDQLLDLPEFFLAPFKNKFVLVSKTENAIKIEDQNQITQTLSFNEFVADWDGIVLAIEQNEEIIKQNAKTNFKVLKYGLPLVFLIAISILLNYYTIYDFAILAISIIGFIVSVFIVQEKFGIKNQIVTKFCNIGTTVSCDSVIKSKGKDFVNWFNFSELPLFFFGSSVLSLLFVPSSSSFFIGFLSFCSLPILLFSIWIQKFQIKKWCVLCLAVSFLIISETIFWIFLKGFSFNLSLLGTSFFILALAVVYTTWTVLKPTINKTVIAERELKTARRFKRNFSVFKFLSKDIPEISGFEKLEGLNFGNENSSLKLSIILSPSCGHCHKVFQDSFELVSKFPNKVFLNVLFNINPENNENPYRIVVERLMIINKSEPEKMVEAISDWHIKKMDLKKWTEKWNNEVEDIIVNQEIQKQYDWCVKNEFNYTPVRIINDKQFPDEYDLNDLKYFLNDFEEENKFLEIETQY